MLGRALLLLTLILAPLQALSYVEVAFFEKIDDEGKTESHEENGRFNHVAISYQGKWLHADGYYDVVIWDHETMEKVGQKKFGKMTVIAIPESNEPTAAQVAEALKLEFDHFFTWDLPGTTYCAKLVGQILGIAPRPMTFQGARYEGNWASRRGEPGLSPDDIHEELVKMSERRAKLRLCQKAFSK